MDKTFIFFSARERAEFNKYCVLTGSGRGRNFPTLRGIVVLIYF